MGCACSPCRGAVMGEYVPGARMGGVARMAGVDAGTCDEVIGLHLDAAEVTAFKMRVGAFFVSTDAAVQACATLAPAERATWEAFYASWKLHSANFANFWTAGEQWRATCAFARTLDAFRDTLRSQCTVPGPAKILVENPAQTELLSAVKWGAAAILVAAVVYGVTRVV